MGQFRRDGSVDRLFLSSPPLLRFNRRSEAGSISDAPISLICLVHKRRRRRQSNRPNIHMYMDLPGVYEFQYRVVHPRPFLAFLAYVISAISSSGNFGAKFRYPEPPANRHRLRAAHQDADGPSAFPRSTPTRFFPMETSTYVRKPHMQKEISRIACNQSDRLNYLACLCAVRFGFFFTGSIASTCFTRWALFSLSGGVAVTLYVRQKRPLSHFETGKSRRLPPKPT